MADLVTPVPPCPKCGRSDRIVSQKGDGLTAPWFVCERCLYPFMLPPPSQASYVTPTEPMPAESLFEFVRGSDHAPMSSEVKFCGESYGWQAAFYVRGEFFASHGAFP